jgi:hypothetical protein
MHAFRTGDGVQRSCGVTNKLLSKVLTELLVWHIVTMHVIFKHFHLMSLIPQFDISDFISEYILK